MLRTSKLMNFEAKGSSSSSVSPPSTLRDCDATHDTEHSVHHSFDPFDTHYCSPGTAIKHPVLDWPVKPVTCNF